MKWTAVTLDLSRVRKMGQNAGIFSKTFATLGACTLMLFGVLGLAGYVQTKASSSPVSSMKGLASAVSGNFFLDMMGMEIPHMNKEKEGFTFSQSNLFTFAFRLVTDVNPRDPKTLIAREVPGLGADGATLLRKGMGTDDSGPPQDYTSSIGSGASGTQGQGQGQGGTSLPPASSPSPSPSPSPSAQPAPSKPTTNGKKVVMFYHSHNRESWVPELGINDPNKAFDKKTNITLIGKYLADKLDEKGVGAIDYNTDYPDTVGSAFNYYYSYKYSNKTVKEAMVANPDLDFMFDIHRDDQPRNKTTLTVDGKDYAQIFFIVGQKNPNWKENEQFASRIQEQLEKRVSGISRGIWGKTAKEGDGEYNQSVSPNNMLVEIGGPYNTIEECKRTADVLADVIAELYWEDAKKADAPQANAPAKK